jgi:hypothetical protein
MESHQQLTLPDGIKGGIPKKPRWANANSVAAFKALSGDSHWQIFNVFLNSKHPLTDRQVKKILNKEDMNNVRPRISELIDFDFLVVIGDVKDETTGLLVRKCAINWKKLGRKEEQQTFDSFERTKYTNGHLIS